MHSHFGVITLWQRSRIKLRLSRIKLRLSREPYATARQFTLESLGPWQGVWRLVRAVTSGAKA